MRANWIVIAGCLSLTAPASAAVYRVPCDVARITDALALSVDGDVISVDPGTYAPSTNGETFPLEMLHDVTLCGSGMGVSILDAEGSASVVSLKGYSPRLSGFTLTGGRSSQGGGLVVWDNTAPEIDHNLVLANGASSVGSGAFIAAGATPYLHHNVFWANFDVVPASGGDPHGLQFYNAGGIVEQNLFGRGDSNGLHVNTSMVVIRNNIFYENGMAGVRGRGICAVGGAIPVVAHNVFFGNVLSALLIAPAAGDVSATQANALSSDDSIYGNLDGDPDFVNADALNWNLSPQSLAIDAGDPLSPLDPDGTRADIGPFHVPASPSGLGDIRPEPRLFAAPNPFAGSTSLSYRLERATRVSVTIHDPAGRLVAKLVDEVRGPGVHVIAWDGTGHDAIRVAPGVYFAQLRAGTESHAEPLVLRR